jgi:preprotein translocase subunit SecG
MESIIIFVHVIAAVAITGLVLIQQGKGADMGASFGSGASQTLFGSSGSGNVLTRSTSIMAIVFFITSLGLAVIARQQADMGIQDSGLIQNLDEITAQQEAAFQAAEDIPVVEEAAGDSDIPEVSAETSDIPEVIETAAE